MNEQFHIIIAGDQYTPRSFRVSQKNIILTVSISLVVLFLLAANTFFVAGFFTHNRILTKKMTATNKKMNQIETINANFEKRLDEIVAQKDRELVETKSQSELLISQLQIESGKRIADLEKKNLLQEASFKQERELLLSTAVSELTERSQYIETVMSDIGIKVDQTKGKKKKIPKNSGGPYVAAEKGSYDNLIYRTDTYLKTLQTLPLGKPVKGVVSSWYGKRLDPLNSKAAFHSGVDFRGEKGDPVIATADGKIVFAGVNGSGYGKYIKIDHGNGYVTGYGHLLNYHVKNGDHVTRGQVIGLVGNSGRSTGYHLHYEITYKDQYVNPSKFMKVASLTHSFKAPVEKK